MTARPVIGVIGGSGLYEMPDLTQVTRKRVGTPFGDPSDEYTIGHLGDCTLVFLPRHGLGHRILPHEINYRANLWGLKHLGAEWVISVSAVGSLKEEVRPGDLVVVDQFIDRTRARASTFFGEGFVAHVPFADPVCPELAGRLRVAAADAIAALGPRAEGAPAVHGAGTLVVMEGPQFSTRAESRLYRSMGADLIGMTALPEAKLAREAELSYATLALVTDYDCWRKESDVSVAEILATARRNVTLAQDVIRRVAPRLTGPRSLMCQDALRHAIMTDPAAIPAATRARLALFLDKYL